MHLIHYYAVHWTLRPSLASCQLSSLSLYSHVFFVSLTQSFLWPSE